MSRNKTPHLAALALGLGALLAAGCAAKPQVRQHQDPSADLHRYKTFAFYEPLATERGRYSTPLGSHLKRATREALEREHYVYDETDPDLRVNLFAMVVERTDLRSTPAGPGFYGAGRVDSVDYRQGTVIVDLVDADRKALVWRGVAEGRLSETAMKNPQAAIDTAVSEIFAQYPG